jgi:hypothetical protein
LFFQEIGSKNLDPISFEWWVRFPWKVVKHNTNFVLHKTLKHESHSLRHEPCKAKKNDKPHDEVWWGNYNIMKDVKHSFTKQGSTQKWLRMLRC